MASDFLVCSGGAIETRLNRMSDPARGRVARARAARACWVVGASDGVFPGKPRGISTMHTNTESSNAAEAAIKRPRPERRGLQRLVPRPFYLISSAFYLGVLAGFLYTFATELSQSQQCGCSPEWVLRLVVMTCAIAALFALDRLEYRLYGEETPRRAAIILFLVRVLVYEVAASTGDYPL